MKRTSFETKKTLSLAHQLIKVGRLINNRGLANSRKSLNLPNLKQSHLDLFPYIDFEGTSISDLAKKKDVSKQAISKLVQEMVQMKLLELKVDKKDSRSKLVFFKTKGPFAIQKGFKILEKIDKELSSLLGKNQYKSTTNQLTKIIDHILLNDD